MTGKLFTAWLVSYCSINSIKQTNSKQEIAQNFKGQNPELFFLLTTK